MNENDSILDFVKRDLGIVPEYTHFDPIIIGHINTALSILTQLGVGPDEGFAISDNTAVWTDFIPATPKLELIKSYTSKKVKQLFDPPTTGPLSEAQNKVLNELEWRINVIVDPGEENQNG